MLKFTKIWKKFLYEAFLQKIAAVCTLHTPFIVNGRFSAKTCSGYQQEYYSQACSPKSCQIIKFCLGHMLSYRENHASHFL